MKEQVVKSLSGNDTLRVYPSLPDDASERLTAAAGYIEALPYWNDESEKVYGIRINIVYSTPLSRKTSDNLQAAINRCWEWIAEQTA